MELPSPDLTSERSSESVNIDPEEYAILFNKLAVKSTTFDTKKRQRAGDVELTPRLEKKRLYLQTSDGKTIVSGGWCFIAKFGAIPERGGFCWIWSWGLTDKKPKKLAAALDKLPDAYKQLAKYSCVEFTSPIFISYLEAFLCEEMPCEHILVLPVEDNTYSIFGLRDLQWELTEVEPFDNQTDNQSL